MLHELDSRNQQEEDASHTSDKTRRTYAEEPAALNFLLETRGNSSCAPLLYSTVTLQAYKQPICVAPAQGVAAAGADPRAGATFTPSGRVGARKFFLKTRSLCE